RGGGLGGRARHGCHGAAVEGVRREKLGESALGHGDRLLVVDGARRRCGRGRNGGLHPRDNGALEERGRVVARVARGNQLVEKGLVLFARRTDEREGRRSEPELEEAPALYRAVVVVA